MIDFRSVLDSHTRAAADRGKSLLERPPPQHKHVTG